MSLFILVFKDLEIKIFVVSVESRSVEVDEILR